ncbi:MAG: dihydrofolate reductase [Verrucomicrobia bacterium]|nr:dihydrofolate reductase [Verrucomicrobiota bacterium]
MKAIAAMSRNRVIGRGNALPWHLPEDFRWFKRTTLGQGVLMGRKTFDSLGGKPLPGRLNLVVTRRGDDLPASDNVVVVPDLAAFRPEDYPVPEIFVAGGAEIYRQTLPRCSELLLTLVPRDIADGDTFFPPFEHLFDCAEIVFTTADFEVRRYVNRQLPQASSRR